MKIESKKDMIKVGISMIFGGAFVSLFIITAIIGIPMMIIGAIMILIAPFYTPKKK